MTTKMTSFGQPTLTADGPAIKKTLKTSVPVLDKVFPRFVWIQNSGVDVNTLIYSSKYKIEIGEIWTK